MTSTNERVAYNLYHIIKNRHINVSKLCSEIGMLKQTFYNLMNFKTDKSIRNLELVCRYLKININKLLEDNIYE